MSLKQKITTSMLLTDNIKMDTTIPTKIKWKIHALYCFTLYFKFILKLLFIKICKIQPPDLLFVVFISIYSGRYNFSQTFRTLFSISYLKKRFLHMLQLCPFERLPSSRFFQKSPFLEHVYMRPEVNSNRFEISKRFEKSFRLHGDFTAAACKW